MVCLIATCTFINVTFKQCSLLVLCGTRAILQEPSFVREGEEGISMVVHGPGTTVSVSGGSITGGIQGVLVCQGAQLEANDLTISAVHARGAEVKDEGSLVKLNQCNLHSFCHRSHAMLVDGSVYVHSESRAALVGVSMSCDAVVDSGVLVCTRASASMKDCKVADAVIYGVLCSDAATGHLEGSTVSNTVTSGGVYVLSKGAVTRVEAQCCHVLQSRDCGMHVSSGGYFACSVMRKC